VTVHYSVIILGAGWSGLSCAREILKLDKGLSVLVLEKSSRDLAGGLLRTERLAKGTYDIAGPHILISKNHGVLDDVLSLAGPVRKLTRKNSVLIDGERYDYPLENGLWKMSEERRKKVCRSILSTYDWRERNAGWQPTGVMDWIDGFFGKEFGNLYLTPYTQKVWKRPLHRLSAEWVYTPGRVPTPKREEIELAMSGVPGNGYAEQSTFYYPERGIQSIWNGALADATKRGAQVIFSANVNVAKLAGESAHVTWNTWNSLRVKAVVSTLPIGKPELTGWNSLYVVGGTVKEKDPIDELAVYLPSPELLIHRITRMSYLIPCDSGTCVMAEVTVPQNEPPPADLVARASREIEAVFHAPFELEKVWHHPYAYPVVMVGGEAERQHEIDRLEKQRIFPAGRWGAWRYWNTDMVLMDAQRVAAKVIGCL